jgi:hypothetical protein
MSWGVGTRYLPRVVSYIEADALESTVVPIRGSGTNAGKKPAGNRKYPYITICRDAEGTIIVQGFGGPLIKYFPNDTIWIARAPYYQVTSNDIYSSILGQQVYSYDGKPWLPHVFFGVGGVPEHGHLPLPKEGAYLESIGGSWKLLNPEFPKVHKINRKKMNKVRAQYKPFLKYFSGMMKLKDGDPVGGDDACTVPRFASSSYTAMLTAMGSDSLEDWNELASYLMRKGASYRWVGGNYAYMYKYSAAMRKANDVLLHTHRDLVFDVKEITTGWWVKDTNKKYFNT